MKFQIKNLKPKFLLPTTYYLLLTTFFLPSPVFAQDAGVINIPRPERAIPDIGKLISSGVTAAIIIAALATFAFLVWGGIEWLTSGGDKAKYEAARDRITAAVIGLAIVAAAWAIMKLVGIFFGIDITGDFNFPNAAGNKWMP